MWMFFKFLIDCSDYHRLSITQIKNIFNIFDCFMFNAIKVWSQCEFGLKIVLWFKAKTNKSVKSKSISKAQIIEFLNMSRAKS